MKTTVSRLFFALLLLPNFVVAEFTPISLQIADDADQQIFVATFTKPQDFRSEPRDWHYYQSSFKFDIPRLRSKESTQNLPIYFESNRASGDELTEANADKIVFVGRVPKAIGADLNLVLEYPTSTSDFKQEDVVLDLKKANSFKPSPRPTAASWEPTPNPKASKTISAKERWATAQSDFFVLLADTYGDSGGFFSFAQRQTRRAAGLSIPAESLPDPFLAMRSSADAPEMMYQTTTGALAIQESLQLDRMLGSGAKEGPANIDIATLQGVKTESHPFDEMRKDKEPKYNPIAELVPANNYILSFNGVEKLLELVDFLDQWGTSALELYEAQSVNYDVHARIQQQLGLPDSLLTRLIGDQVISQTAITGNDPFLREGSDVTILFEVKNRALFEQVLDGEIANIQSGHADVVDSEDSIGDYKVRALLNPDRSVSSYRTWIDSTAVVSNSRVAIERIVATKAGSIASVAKTPDFKYMRAVVYPYDATSEDGFLYLSDDFIRNLVSPQVRIKEKRRIEAITSLKLLTNAQLFERYQSGTSVELTKAELIKAKTLYKSDIVGAGSDDLDWDKQNHRAASKSYGTLRFATPLIELPIKNITEQERSSYQAFVDNYEHYWRRYFDPIGVRIKVGPKIKFDVTILPLIADSSYDSLKDMSAGNLVRIEPAKFPPETLFRLVFHINPDGRDLKEFKNFFQLMNSQSQNSAAPSIGGMLGNTVNVTDWIGEWVSFWVADTGTLKTMAKRAYAFADGSNQTPADQFDDFFNIPFVLGIHQKNAVSLTSFLVALRALIQGTAPDMVVYTNLEPYKGVTIVKISEGQAASSFRPPGAKSPAFYYATVADGFYISTHAEAIKGLIDHSSNEISILQPQTAPAVAQSDSFDAHAFSYVSAGNSVRDTVRFLLEQQAYSATIHNFGAAWIVGRLGFSNGAIDSESQQNLLGYKISSPSGGEYIYDPKTDLVSSSVYGSMQKPIRRDDAPADSPVTKMVDAIERIASSMRFTPEGLSATLQINRKMQ